MHMIAKRQGERIKNKETNCRQVSVAKCSKSLISKRCMLFHMYLYAPMRLCMSKNAAFTVCINQNAFSLFFLSSFPALVHCILIFLYFSYYISSTTSLSSFLFLYFSLLFLFLMYIVFVC